jgi:hypothetical protein
MTFAVLGDLNWLAVIVAALLYFLLGGIWYMPPVFGDRWTRSIGWDASEEESPGPAFYIAPAITAVIATIVVAMLAAATGSSTVGEGIVLGLLVGVGVAGTVLFTTGYFDPHKPQPMTWFGITAGYHAVGILIAAIIVAIW